MRFTPLEMVKLPVWARQRITALEVDLVYWKKIQAAVAGKTRVSQGYEEPIYFPEHEVDFSLGDDYRSRIGVKIITDGAGKRWLSIRGASRIVVLPDAANAIELGIEPL